MAYLNVQKTKPQVMAPNIHTLKVTEAERHGKTHTHTHKMAQSRYSTSGPGLPPSVTQGAGEAVGGCS